MFSIKLHEPGEEGHTMHECIGYKVRPNGDGKTVLMTLKDGTIKPLDVLRGGVAFVMNDHGKTCDIISAGHAPRTAVMRGGRG